MTDRPRFIDTADPSWYKQVLEVLDRDYPKISDKVWGTAISENAVRLSTKAADDYRNKTAGNSQPDPS